MTRDDYPSGPLSKQELQEVRRILEADKFARRTKALIRTSAAWITVVLGALWAAYDTVAAIVKKLVLP